MSQHVNSPRPIVGCSGECPAAKALRDLRNQNAFLKEQVEVLRMLVAAMHIKREAEIHKDPNALKAWVEQDLGIRIAKPPVSSPVHQTYNDVYEMREVIAEHLDSDPDIVSAEVLGIPRNPVFLPCRCAPGGVEHDCSFTGRAGDIRVTFNSGNVAIVFVMCGIDPEGCASIASRAAVTYYSTVSHGIPPPEMFTIIATSREHDIPGYASRLVYACQELILKTVVAEEPEIDDIFGPTRLTSIEFKEAFKNPLVKKLPGITATPPGPKPTYRLIRILESYHDPKGLVASSLTNPGIILPHITRWVYKEREIIEDRPIIPVMPMEGSDSPVASIDLNVQAAIPKLIHPRRNNRIAAPHIISRKHLVIRREVP